MNCNDFTERVESLLDGLLPADEAQALRAHAASCRPCGEELACAEKFRALLARDGRDAMVAAADREAVVAARAEAAATRGAVRPMWFKLAAAAVVVAAFAAGAFVAGDASPSGDSAVTGSTELARGERRVVGEGRTVTSDDAATAIEVVDEAHVRLVSGAAMFQVEHGRPFQVETDLGTAEVHGTLFHVARRANGAVSVAVSSGEVVFRPSKGGAVRKLRAGAAIEVSPAGVQVFVSREQAADESKQAAALREELQALRGDLARRDEETVALKAQLAAAQASGAPAADPEEVWRELGTATCEMLIDPSPGATPAPVKQSLVGLEKFQKHVDLVRQVTGSTRIFEAPSHPGMVARTADGFVEALAPLVSETDRARAAAAIRAAATEALQAMAASTTQAEVYIAQLTMYERITAALRDHLGAVSAARVSRTSMVHSEGLFISPATDTDPALRKRFQDIWLRRLGQDEEQRASIDAAISAWVASAKSVQATVLAEWGDAAGRAFLFPEDPMRVPQRASPGEAPSAPQLDDDQAVALSLRRIDAKKRLLAARIDFERSLLSRVDAEQAAVARADLRGAAPFLWTFK